MYSKYFQKQKMMRTVLIALAPIIIYGIYVFGWRVLALLAFNIVVASGVEYICERLMYNKNKVTEAAFVTATILTMTLPPQIPFWISGVGVAAAIFFGKEVFGGFGRNPFNPAIVGRAFIYINFPGYMLRWNEAANSQSFVSGLGGFTKWITPLIDTSTSATPMVDIATNGATYSPLTLLLGNHGGSIGEISALLILLGGAYMIYKKIASWELMLSTMIGFLGISYLLIVLGFDADVLPPLEGILVGGFMFGAVFMVTDPISAPKQSQAKWIYGIIVGVSTVLIRSFANFPEGMMFAILIAEVFGPIIDYVFADINKKKRLAKKALEAQQAKAKEV